MSILINSDTKILIQGITGEFGARHTKLSLDYGTKRSEEHTSELQSH